MKFNLFLAAGSVAVGAVLWSQESAVRELEVAALIIALGMLLAAGLQWAWPQFRLSYRAAVVAVAALIFLTLVAPMFLQMSARRDNGRQTFVHDGALQMEEAVTMLDRGKNPYTETFRGTPVERWAGTAYHPAVDHFIYLPGHLLLADAASHLPILPKPYEDRLLSFTAYLAALALVIRLAPNPVWKLRAAIGIGLNPLIVPYLANGRNDTVVFAFVAAAFGLFSLGRRRSSALSFGASLTIKAFSWVVAPVYATLLIASASGRTLGEKIRSRLGPLALMLGVALAILLPFILWNPPAFFDDVIGYPFGFSAYSSRIQGGGFSALLLNSGVIQTLEAKFPFWAFQLPVAIVLLATLLPWVWRKPVASRAAAASAGLLLGVGYFGRYFTENHVGLILLLGWLAAVLQVRERSLNPA